MCREARRLCAPAGTLLGPPPRVRGAKKLSAQSRAACGPPPRVRGSRPFPKLTCCRLRSTPACAGKPSYPPTTRRGTGVHPRMCGEASMNRKISIPWTGPAPHVRGSRFLARGPRAGPTVHPRMCGEARAETAPPRDVPELFRFGCSSWARPRLVPRPRLVRAGSVRPAARSRGRIARRPGRRRVRMPLWLVVPSTRPRVSC